MTNKQVAEAFADNKQTTVRGKEIHSYNMFIDGKTIFSYGHHFPIATHTGKYLEDRREIILFTTREYSVSTSAHKSLVRDSLNSIMFFVIETHNAEVNDTSIELSEAIDNALLKATRARKEWTRAGWTRDAGKYQEQLKVFNQHFI